MRLTAIQEYDIAHTICTLLEKSSKEVSVDARRMHKQYLSLTKDEKEKLWQDAAHLIMIPQEAILDFYFFKFIKEAYTGSLETIKPMILKKIQQYDILPHTDINMITKEVMQECMPQAKMQDIHPGSVQKFVQSALKQRRNQSTPRQTTKLRQTYVYLNTPSQQLNNVEICKENGADEKDMINVLQELLTNCK